jgi:uncharacterized membrane protein
MPALSQVTLEDRYPSPATIRRGPSENPVHDAEDRGSVAAVFYIAAGSLHFIRPAPYLKIMPPYIPWHAALVRISGAFEILGGLGLLAAATRRAAAWRLVTLLVAVFPANIYMALHPAEAGAALIAPVLRWGRLPLQAVLIWWLLWCTAASLCAPLKRTVAIE